MTSVCNFTIINKRIDTYTLIHENYEARQIVEFEC